MSLDIMPVKNYNSVVTVNVGTAERPCHYSISEDKADEFCKAYKKQGKYNRFISDAGIFSSVTLGYLIVNKFAKNLKSIPKFILCTIGGICTSLITAPVINNVTQSKLSNLTQRYGAIPTELE